MASLDEELLKDEEENRREIAFIREQLPSDLKERFSDEQLQFIIDAIGTYFYESGILETNDDEVDVDMEVIAQFVCKEAEEEDEGPFDAQDVYWVVEADLDFQEEEA
jgi:aspartate/tyrosine/aromatic aminotransferase